MHGSCSNVRIIASQYNLFCLQYCATDVSGGAFTELINNLGSSSSPYVLTFFIAPEDFLL